MLEVPPPMNDCGDIDAHNQEGFVISFDFGALDVSDKVIWFETSAGIRIQLVDGDSDFIKRLVVTQGQLSPHLGKVGTYAIIDETDALNHDLILEGNIRVRGF